MNKITREEFLKSYLEKSGLDKLPEEFSVEKCDCNEPGCKGWAIVSDRDRFSFFKTEESIARDEVYK